VIVCYAYGGGLGHLTRVRAFLHTARPGVPATIISGSPHAADPRVAGPHPVLRPPPGLYRAALARWIGDTLRALAPDELVVDAFPAGLHGELADALVPRTTRTVTHLARLLRWDAYRAVVPASPLRFDRTLCVEPVAADHHEYLASASSAIEPLRLADSPPTDSIDLDPAGLAAGAWLIVHTGPDRELSELLDYARDTAALEGIRPRLVLVSPYRPAGLPAAVGHLDTYPAWPLFRHADRIVTAAGCNAVRQVRPWRERHRMVPFPRRFDDQFTRAARERTGAGSYA
jgi:hypothetical protein